MHGAVSTVVGDGLATAFEGVVELRHLTVQVRQEKPGIFREGEAAVRSS